MNIDYLTIDLIFIINSNSNSNYKIIQQVGCKSLKYPHFLHLHDVAPWGRGYNSPHFKHAFLGRRGWCGWGYYVTQNRIF